MLLLLLHSFCCRFSCCWRRCFFCFFSYFTAGDFPIPVSYFFQETQAEVAAAAAAATAARERERTKVSSLLSRLLSCCCQAPRTARVWNSKRSTIIKRSTAFKEEQESKAECCIERRVHLKKTKLKRRVWNCIKSRVVLKNGIKRRVEFNEEYSQNSSVPKRRAGIKRKISSSKKSTQKEKQTSLNQSKHVFVLVRG